MPLDKNILKNMLNKLLESRLQNLEARNKEQLKDLKTAKIELDKQGLCLKNIAIRKTKKTLIRKNTFDNKNRLLLSKKDGADGKYQRVTPVRTKKKPNYKESNKNNVIYNRKNKTPEPIKNFYLKNIYKDNKDKKPKNEKKHNNRNEENKIKKKNNIKIIEVDNKIDEKEKKNRNNNSIIREEDNIKKTIISDLGLEKGEIEFVLKQIEKKGKDRKESDEIDSSIYKSSSESSFHDKETYQTSRKKSDPIINRFIEYTNSSDGKKIITLICSFLDNKSNINFLSCTKKYIKYLVIHLNNLYDNIKMVNEVNLKPIEEQINSIMTQYGEDELDSTKSFSLSEGSVKALELLNNDLYNYIFKKEKLESPYDEIIIVYRIFFQLINDEDICNIQNDKIFWEKTRKYILEKNKGKTGKFIKDYVSEFDFTNQNIYKLKKLVYGNEYKLKPLYYEEINKTTGLIVFVLKDSLEYCGIFQNNKKTMPSIVLQYLEYISDNIKTLKNYIDSLKKLMNQLFLTLLILFVFNFSI